MTKRITWVCLLFSVMVVVVGCGSEGASDGVGGFGTASGESASVTNTVPSPADMAVGDIYQSLYTMNQQGVIDLTGVDANATFVLALANFGDRRGSSTVQIDADLAVDPSSKNVTVDAQDEQGESWEWTATDALHSQLRNLELSLSAQVERGSLSTAKAARGTSTPRVGDQERFRVLSSVSSFSSYRDVTAEIRCVGDHVLWYMDQEVLTGDAVLRDDELQALCRSFDAVVEKEYAMIGEASDVNGDGRVAVLMTPVVNRMGASGGGTITGYFLASDLHARSSSNVTSNFREMLYVMAPDPSGKYGFRVSKDLALKNLLPAVLPHELQHAISYNQHVFEHGGAPEESWLNEGLSHLMEDVMGAGLENPSRYELYLQRPNSYPIVTAGAPGLAERGGTFLFLRYLYEQHPESAAFLRGMLQTDLTGIANLEGAYAATDANFDQFSEFVLRWSAALVLNNRGLTSDARYGYGERAWDSSQSYYSGVCTVCEVKDGRGTVLDGVEPVGLGAHSTVQFSAGAVHFFLLSGGHRKIQLWSTDAVQYGVSLVRIR